MRATLIPREAEADASDAVELPLPGQAVDRLVAAGARAQGLQLGRLRVEVSSANTASTQPAFRILTPCAFLTTLKRRMWIHTYCVVPVLQSISKTC